MKNQFSFEFEGNTYEVIGDKGEPFFFKMKPFPCSTGDKVPWMIADDMPRKIVEQAKYIYHEGI